MFVGPSAFIIASKAANGHLVCYNILSWLLNHSTLQMHTLKIEFISVLRIYGGGGGAA